MIETPTRHLCVIFSELVGSILPPSMLPILWFLGGGQMTPLLGHRKLDFHYVLLCTVIHSPGLIILGFVIDNKSKGSGLACLTRFSWALVIQVNVRNWRFRLWVWTVLSPVTAFKTWGNARRRGHSRWNEVKEKTRSQPLVASARSHCLGLDCSDWIVSGLGRREHVKETSSDLVISTLASWCDGVQLMISRWLSESAWNHGHRPLDHPKPLSN
jgi:hypothetical protein